MGELLDAGGCWNANRFALDEAGGATRKWRGAIETDQIFLDSEQLILACDFDGDDMNVASNATFKVQWRNVSDVGSWTDLASTGEIKWGTSSLQMTNNATIVVAETNGGVSVDCTGKGWSNLDAGSKEGVGRNGFTQTVQDDEYFELQWLIDLSGADSANQDQYEFRITESGGTVIGTGLRKVTVIIEGHIPVVSRNKDSSAVLGSCQVTAYLSDEATPPKPVGGVVAQIVTNGSGVGDLTGLASGAKYFLHYYKDDTTDVADGTIEITAVAV